MSITKDNAGKKVTVGCTVRVLSIEATLLQSLAPDERLHVESMIGDDLEVYEINEYGYAMVEKEWQIGPGEYTSHSIALAPKEMALVGNAT
jgi:hypothetical protein